MKLPVNSGAWFTTRWCSHRWESRRRLASSNEIFIGLSVCREWISRKMRAAIACHFFTFVFYRICEIERFAIGSHSSIKTSFCQCFSTMVAVWKIIAAWLIYWRPPKLKSIILSSMILLAMVDGFRVTTYSHEFNQA